MGIRKITPELLKVAETKLNEIPERQAEDIEEIRQWLNKHPCIIGNDDDQWILSFLRGCKFSLERTKEKLTHYYMMKKVAPEFFTKRDPFDPELQDLLKMGVFIPLRKSADPIAPRVLLIHNCGGATSVANLVKVALMIMDILVYEDDNFIIAGHVVLQNFKSVTLNHAVQLTPTMIKNIVECFQNSYPSRPKQFHFINTPSFFNNVFSVMKTFLADKLKKRITVYNDEYQIDLLKQISRDILPQEYGGTGPTLQELIDEWKTKVEGYREWFLEDEKYTCTNLNIMCTALTEKYVLNGSFRQLTVD